MRDGLEDGDEQSTNGTPKGHTMVPQRTVE